VSTSSELIVNAGVGLHARPAAEFVKLAQEFNGKVTLKYGEKEADGKSMIGILKLAVKQGTKFELTLDGENENEFMKKFELLVSKND
jgi:phosphotransferase system HPr (HPr) family protein